MTLENSPPANRNNQKRKIENIKNIQKERFKSEDKSFLNDWDDSKGFQILIFSN